MEAHFESDFGKLLPLTPATLVPFLLYKKEKGAANSTLNGILAAVGTLATWIGFPRARLEMYDYIITDKSVTRTPPKLRVNSIPLRELVIDINYHASTVCLASLLVVRTQLAIACLMLLRPARPQTMLATSLKDSHLY